MSKIQTTEYDSILITISHNYSKFLILNFFKERPYVMVKDDKNLTGNDRFEGFCIDLLKAISQQVGFQYTIDLVPDNMYGVFIPETNSWNGIVQELMERVSIQAVKYS